MNDLRQPNLPAETEEEGIKLQLDWRVLLLELRRWSFILGAVFLLLFVVAFVLLSYRNRNSMERWSASAKLFHQTRSEKIPTFYKQLDTKAIAEFTGSAVQLRKVAERLNLAPGEAATLGSRIELVIPKAAPTIIVISATDNNAKMAAELANGIAAVGVEAYIELQNGTLKEMLAERNRRRVVLNGELQKQEQVVHNYLAPGSALPPDEELARLRAQISLDMVELGQTEVEVKRLDVVITETQKQLDVTEREIPYIQKTHNAAAAEFGQMNSALTALEQKYMPSNPRVLAFRDEVGERKLALEGVINEKPTPDEIVYMVNQVCLSLEESLLRSRIEQAGLMIRHEASLRSIEQAQQQVLVQLQQVASYNEAKRRVEATKGTLAQLDSSINDLDLLLNSAVPDLSIMEQATTPRTPQGGGIKLVILSTGAGLFGLFVTGAVLAVWSILFGRIKSSREFELCGKFDDLGALPVAGSSTQDQLRLEAALQRSFWHIREHLGNGRTLFISGLSSNPETEQLTQHWNENFGINGLQVFRLKFAPYAEREATVFPAVTKRQPVDDELICIEKYGAKGWFFANNKLVLAPAELELLQNDLKTLSSSYDIVILERDTPLLPGGDTMFEQLCHLADYTVITAVFDVDNKAQLRRLAANDAIGGRNLGGILTAVRKNFWSIQQS